MPLLDGETAIAFGGIGPAAMPSGQLLLRPSDPDAATETLGRVADRIGLAGGSASTERLEGIEVTTISVPDTIDAAYGIVDGVVVIGLSAADVAAVAEARDSGFTLDGTSAYEQRVRDGRRPRRDRGLGRRRHGRRACSAWSSNSTTTHAISFRGSGPSRSPFRSRPDHIEFHAVLTVEEP